MQHPVLNVAIFAVGWLLFVLGQAQNSLRSSSNGLIGWAGWRQWLQMQAINLATRAFFSGLAYGYIVATVTAKLQAIGFQFTATTIAGLGGYAANALLYQFFGLIPWFRVEVGELAPPAPPKNGGN